MSEQSFGKWRRRLWPIERYEHKKLIPLLFIKFFISFIYGILYSMKDTFIVTGKGSGAEVIPVLKGWIVLPVALLVTLLYSKLSNHFKRSTLFYGIISCFLIFFLVYSFILYPQKDLLSPHHTADLLIANYGAEYSHWVAIFRNWMQTIFFVVAELWAPLVIFMLFWGFCNQINVIGDAKRYYTLFIAAGDLAALCTGPLVGYYAHKYAHTHFLFTIQSLSLCITFFGLVVMALHWWVTKYVLTDPKLHNPETIRSQEKTKTKLSLFQGLKLIASSKYLRNIAIMVLGYGLAINLVEVSWKANLKLQFPNASDYQAFMGMVTSIVGAVSLFTAFFLGGGIIRFFGWHFSAQITPIVVGVTGILFFLLLQTQHIIEPLTAMFGISPLLLIVIFGTVQNISSKVVKYSFFDPTKEMSYIPLDQESKVKGKAAIDVVGSRLGKSGSAWIQLALIQMVGTGSVLSISHFLLPFMTITVFFWITSIKSLNKQFLEKTGEQERADETEPQKEGA